MSVATGPSRWITLLTVTAIVASLTICAHDSSAASGPSPKQEIVTTPYGGTLTIDPEQFHIYDIPTDRFEELTGLPLKYQTPDAPLRELSTRGTKAAAGAVTEGRVLAVLIEWENKPALQFWHSQLAYDSLFFSTDIYPTGSVNEYFQEVSYGAFGITGDVVGWVYMPGSYDVGPGPVNTYGYSVPEIVSLIDGYVNFADYDGDNDGFVDALWIVHAGTGQEETHSLYDIWSHAVRGVNVPTADGVSIDRWSVQPEMHADLSIKTIRVFCHEYGHILGMPDLYDYNGKLDTTTYFTQNDLNDHPLVDWDLMGYAGYSIMSYGNGSCPSHFSGWSRTALGWATPQIPPCLEGTYDLYNIEEHSTNNLFKVPITDDGTEYFLLEYRNPKSSVQFDHLNSDYSAYNAWFTPGRDTLDAGLLVTHIDESVAPNNGWPGQPNYAVTVVDAGFDPAHPWDGTEFTEWWYPYEFRIGALYSVDDPGQTTLSPTTTPSSDGYTGPSGITITVVSQNPDYMTIEINKPSAPVFDPVAPVVMDAGTILDIPISTTDANCTSPQLSQLSLPPYAAFIDQGNGGGTLSLSPTMADLGPATASLLATDAVLLTGTLNLSITVNEPSCACPCFGDPECDGSITVLDVVRTVNIAFRNDPTAADPVCPWDQTDVNCDAATSVIDVVKVVNVAFRNEDPSSQFCSPCGP